MNTNTKNTKNIDKTLDDIDKLIYKLNVLESSKQILKRTPPPLFYLEEWYQSHRIKFSEVYFNSWHNVGPSLIDFLRKKIMILFIIYFTTFGYLQFLFFREKENIATIVVDVCII